jgi:tRNA-Thr(GGU) m(6)t(6)A37 methyltransferase TsaA
MPESFELLQIAIVRSDLADPDEAPMQGNEGAPDAWVEVDPGYAKALKGVTAGQDVILVTWFHLSRRDVLQVHPRSDESRPLTGVFATRSPERPNPLGLHRVTVRQIDGTRLRVGPLEAVDGTPVVDIKPVLDNSADA